jgi:hypothetical protein
VLIGSIIAVLLIAAAGLIIYAFLGPTKPMQCTTWRPTVDAPGDNHATPEAAEQTVKPVTDQDIIEQP